jgi:NAD(P)-dependent dehydrogenase (short-subunit alcohol dehydrogenase family)
VVITGCSSGIGLETALAFAARGDTVVATMRDPSRAVALGQRAAGLAGTVDVVALDVTDDRSVREAVAAVGDRQGAIDVVVNNAGVGLIGAIETMPLDRARQVLETNYWGALRVIQAVLPGMRHRGSGVIINVSSTAGRVPPLPFSSWYAVSKHALCLMSEALHMELLGTGVRVVSLEPGFFRTALVVAPADDGADAGHYAAEEAWVSRFYAERVAAGGDPADVAAAIVEAATDPSTPLHVTVPRALEATIPARITAPFEEMVAAQLAGLESTAGPRPVRDGLA